MRPEPAESIGAEESCLATECAGNGRYCTFLTSADFDGMIMSEHSLKMEVYGATTFTQTREAQENCRRQGSHSAGGDAAVCPAWLRRHHHPHDCEGGGCCGGNHFPSKRHILLSLIQQASVPVVTSRLASAEGQSDEEILRTLFTERIEFGRQYAPLLKTLLSEAMHDAELAQQLIREVMQPLSALLKEYIAKRIERGDFREVPVDIAVRALVGAFWFTIVYDHLLACDPTTKAEVLGSCTPEEYARWFVNLLLGGIMR